MTRAQFLASMAAAPLAAAPREYRKINDVVLYTNPRFYVAFPSIVRRPSGELLVAFRRAPDRRLRGALGVSHTDPNAYLVMVRSRDNGATWTKEPELIWAHPEAGSQDPCMVQLKDGSILCASYAWYETPAVNKEVQPYGFLGGFLVRSRDGGKSWQGPIIPAPTPGVETKTPFGEPLPSYNRGAMVQGRDGRLYWAVAHMNPKSETKQTGISLMISADGGDTWKYSCPICVHEKIGFNETSMYETPKGDLIAFVRTEKFDDQTVIARSSDGGKSFTWESAGFQGHPHHAIRLPDNRVWLVYGYRHKPYGIRARVLNAECTDAKTAPEIVLRDDGGSGDLGYPWATLLPGGKVLSVYYFNKEHKGAREISGTICG